MFKKEYLYLGLIVFLVIALAVVIVSRSPRIDTVYPEERLELQKEDFVVNIDNAPLTVGFSSWDEAMNLFPDSERLGGSTIYRPENLPIYLTFSEDENILVAVHISGDQATTSRGIAVGDSPGKAVEQYGKNYVRFSIKDSGNNDYDMLYGKSDGNTVIFQVRNDSIAKIVVQHTP